MQATIKGTKSKVKKETRGGKRPGAGRPSQGIDGEVKKTLTIRIYPATEKLILEKYGSIQKAIDSMAAALSRGIKK